jgi:hypothetical protein
LAYVAAGKVHKKHLILGEYQQCSNFEMMQGRFSEIDIFMFLLSGAAHGKISAVLVEGQKMYYIYHKVPGNQASGHQDVVDMHLEAGESVLGARLSDSTTFQATAQANDRQFLLLLTQKRLILHVLKV